MDKHLIIFIKNPELGKAKTRIAKTTGDERALEIYKELLEHTCSVTSTVDCKRHLFYSSFIDVDDQWTAKAFEKKLQIPGGLGDKIQHAFSTINDPVGRKLIIGSDCGDLSPEIIDHAFTALMHRDVVLGPTFDGGYYLLGLKDTSLDLFSDIAWSTESVYTQTLEKIHNQNLSYTELPRLNDIDYEEDYIAWKDSLG